VTLSIFDRDEAPEWTTKLSRAQLHNVQVEALDKSRKRRRIVGRWECRAAVDPRRQVAVEDGTMMPAHRIVAAGAQRGEISKPGSFSFGVEHSTKARGLPELKPTRRWKSTGGYTQVPTVRSIRTGAGVVT